MAEIIIPSDFIKDRIDIDKNNDFFYDDGGIFNDFESFLSDQPFLFDYNNVSNFSERYWNESISKEIFYFLNKINHNISPKESIVYENSQGIIDKTYLNNEIVFSTKYSINFIDVFNSDAGYNFCKESDIYEYEEREIININFTHTKTNSGVNETQGTEKENYIIIDDIFLDRFFDNEIKEEIKNYFDSSFEEKLMADFYELNSGIQGRELFNKLKDFGILDSNGFLKQEAYGNFISPTFVQRYKNSDTDENPLFFYGIYENKTILFKRVISPWVLPWYNKDGETYSLVRGTDKKVSVLSNSNNLDFTKEQGVNRHNRLIMPRYKRKVEVEDLNRNFWVIAQTISAITAFLFDAEAPIPKMLGGLIGEVIQLWDNIAFLNAYLEIDKQKYYTPPIHREIVYVNIDDLRNYIKYDDFGFNFETIENFDDVEIEFNDGFLLKRKKQNNKFENAIAEYLSNYAQIYKENFDIVLIPIVRLNNYKNGYFSRIIIPGEYTYSKNFENFAEEEAEFYNNLLAAGRKNNEIFFIKNSILCDINAEWKASAHLDFKESFITYTEEKVINGENIVYYSWDINLSDFVEYIYGICENDTGDGFIGCQCLQQANLFQTKNNKPFYGMCDLFFNLPISLLGKGRWRCFPTIRVVDLARRIFNYPQTFNTDETKNAETVYEDGEIFETTEPKYNIIAQFTKFINETNVYLNLFDETKKTVIKEPRQLFLVGDLGYYLNELLSTYRQSLNYNYEIFTFDQQLLRPTNLQSVNYLKYYREEEVPESQQIKEQIASDKEYDRAALRNFLKMFLDYYDTRKTSISREVFWSNLKDADLNIINDRDLFTNKQFRIGYDNNFNEINTSRENLTEGINHEEKVWNSIEKWKEENNSILDDLCNRYDSQIKNENKTTILFVSGQRIFSANAALEEDSEAVKALGDDGLLIKNWKSYSPDVSTIGAAIRVPVGDGQSSSFTYYPKHVRALTRNETEEKGIGLAYLNSYVPRHEETYARLNRKAPFFFFWDENQQDYILIEDLNDERYQYTYSLPLVQKNINNNGEEIIRDTYALSSSSAGNGASQIQILKEREEEEISLINWLVFKTDIGWAANTPMAKWNEEDGELSNFNSDVHFTTFTNLENKINNVSSFSDYYYQMILNRRYINKILSSKEEWYYNSNYCLENLVYNKNSSYYLGMEYWVFGWIKIYEINNNNYNLLSEEFLCDGFNCLSINNEEIREKIQNLSKNNFYYYSNNEIRELILLLKQIKPEWIEPVIDDNKDYFILGKFYSNRDIENKEQWFEDQIILRNETFPNFREQELLYNLSDENKLVWQNKLSTMLVDFCQLDINNLYEIRNWIFPLEGKSNNFFVFDDETNWKNFYDKLSLDDKIYFSNNITTIIEYYLFGPEKSYTDVNDEYLATIYSKRGVIRYGLEAEEELIGKWPRYGTINYWYDFPDPNEGKNIDELREGYEVIQVDNPRNRNFELFKSNYNIPSNLNGEYNKDDLDLTRQGKDYIPNEWSI